MEIVHVRLVDFENGVLRAIAVPKMGTAFEPAVQDQFVAKVVVAHSEHEVIFDPYESAVETEARCLERDDETHQQRSAGHGRVHAGTGFAVPGCHGQGVAEEGAGILFGKMIVDDWLLNAIATVALVQQPVLVCVADAIWRIGPDEPRSLLGFLPQTGYLRPPLAVAAEEPVRPDLPKLANFGAPF